MFFSSVTSHARSGKLRFRFAQERHGTAGRQQRSHGHTPLKLPDSSRAQNIHSHSCAVLERGARLMSTELPAVVPLAVVSGAADGMGTLLLWPPTG